MRCKIHTLYTGQLRSALGLAEDALEFEEPPRLSEALAAAAEQRGKEARRMLFNADGTVQRTLAFIVDGAQVPRGADPALADGSRLTIIVPISGG